MQASERITAAIGAANDRGRTAVIPFITAGYPEPKDFIATLRDVASAGDVVECGPGARLAAGNRSREVYFRER